MRNGRHVNYLFQESGRCSMMCVCVCVFFFFVDDVIRY